MASKLFPAGVIRGYFLDANINSGRDDEEFYLCFGSDGSMSVYIFYSPNKMWSEGSWSEKIFPGEFGNHTVAGRSLLGLVVEKLNTILPEGSETKLGV